MTLARRQILVPSISQRKTRLALLACAAGLALTPTVLAQALTTAFTYQGELKNGTAPASGAHDMRFQLFDAASGGAQVGTTLCVNNVQVVDGRFTVQLDFGTQFSGSQRFLQVLVRADTGLDCTNTSGFTTLSPRQNLTATPHSMYSMTSATSSNATNLNGQPGSFYQNAANLTSGTIPDGRLASTVVRSNVSNTFTGSTTFNGVVQSTNPGSSYAGNGSALTDLNASNVGAGTLSDARLSANVPLKNTANTFTGMNTFNANTFINGFVGVNSTTPVSLNTVMTVRGTVPGNSWNGMYVDSPNVEGRSFYGYATAGVQRAFTEFDGSTNEWRLAHLPSLSFAQVCNSQGDMIFARNVGIGTGSNPPGAKLHVNGSTSGTDVFIGDRAPNFGSASLVMNKSSAGQPFRANILLFDDDVLNMYVNPGGYGSIRNQWNVGDQLALIASGGVTNRPELQMTGAYESVGLTLEVAGLGGYSILNLDNNFRVTNRTSDVAEGGALRIDARPVLQLFQFWRRTAGSTPTETLAASITNTGNFTAAGTITGSAKFFEIDHPSDPANKTLRHACIESNEYKNIYDGTVITDDSGYATIQLPSWMNDLNENFRYQLTIIDEGDSGDPLMWARVARKIDASNTFMIRTSGPGIEVSWQVTGTRKDAFAKANPIVVEQEKSGAERGKYLTPEAFGRPITEGIFSNEVFEAKAAAAAANAPARTPQTNTD